MSFDSYGRSSAGSVAGAWAAGIVGVILALCAIFWLFSFKGTDSGEVCVVREGGPFDGRAIIDVRQPAEGPKPIGVFNHQDCFPTTERDSNDVIQRDDEGNLPTFPTKDSVQVIADGQLIFQFTTDEDKVKEFMTKYGRRKWGGEDLTSDKGRLAFFRERLQPALLDAQREVIGEYECTQLNNLCQYVQDVEAVTQGKVKKVENSQNLSQAARSITEAVKTKLNASFRGDYFENVRYQNLRVRFEKRVQERVTEAQSLRTEAANAELEARKTKAQAKGAADVAYEKARGERRAAFQQEKAYDANPTKRKLDAIEKFCGPDGCDPKVIGGSLDGIIADITK